MCDNMILNVGPAMGEQVAQSMKELTFQTQANKILSKARRRAQVWYTTELLSVFCRGGELFGWSTERGHLAETSRPNAVHNSTF